VFINFIPFLQNTFKQTDTSIYKGSVIGSVKRFQFPILQIGAVEYEITNETIFRDSKGVLSPFT